MQIFYTPDISDNSCTLDENESKHCIRVLRMTTGTRVRLIDGKGNLFEGEISEADPKRCRISILNVTAGFEKRNYRLHIAISPLKNPERFEWFIEKSVEIGIDRITPLICRNTEKPGIKADRVNNIIISAMKQSLKAYRPLLDSPVAFGDFIQGQQSGIKMIAHCHAVADKKSIGDVCPKGSDAVIVIGPEGDFSAEEVNMALAAGFRPVHLGSSRLRTETAGVAACHSIYFINQL